MKERIVWGHASTESVPVPRVGRLVTGVLSAALMLAMASGSRADTASGVPQTYVCTFAKGTSWSFENGAYQSEPAKPISFEVSDIDLEQQSAKFSMNDAKGALKIVRALNANSFIEVAGEGFLNLTTIYDRDSVSGTFPAVHSRHLGVLGQPVFAQYAGTCTAK